MSSQARSALMVTLAAAALLMVTMGVRQSFGLFISPLNSSTGLGIATISFALAIGQFTWGAVQPIAGALLGVVLLGDATYDFQDYLRTGVRNRVPPFMVKTSYLWTASDSRYAAVNGDDVLPDVAIGRLPAATFEQAESMVRKVLAYESDPALSGGPVYLVADDPDEAGDFTASAEELRRGVLASRPSELIALEALLSPDIQFSDPTFHLGANGLMEMRALMALSARELAAVSLAVEHEIVCGSWVVTRQTQSVTRKAAPAIPTGSMRRAERPTISRHLHSPNHSACAHWLPTACLALASCTGALPNLERPVRISQPRCQCIARWTCSTGCARRKQGWTWGSGAQEPAALHKSGVGP